MQFEMSELLLVHEVDKIIRKRLGLPTYPAWREKEIKRRKEIAEFMRPEHWGLSPDSPVAREIRPSPEARVLVAGPEVAKTALYLAANGCSVNALDCPAGN